MNAVTQFDKTPLRQVQKVQHLLMNEQARSQLAMVAAKHMSPERMMRVVANAIRTNAKLQQCDPLSMLGALMECARLGLEPNTTQGHAYLIPFENKRKGITEVQLIVGYKGFIDLARRSGQILSIHADVHYSDDVVMEHEYGSHQRLRHVPGPRQGTKLGAYCHMRLKDGEGHVYMTAADILKIRDGSQGWNSAKRFGKTAESPWVLHEDRMWAKTAVRRLSNTGEMPQSVEFMDALNVDDAHVDYAAYALDPQEGAMIEDQGDEVDGDTGEVVESQTAPKEEAKPASKKATPKPKEEAKPEPKDAREPDQLQSLANTIMADMSEAGRGNTEAVLEMYGQQIAEFPAPLLADIKAHAAQIEAGEA